MEITGVTRRFLLCVPGMALGNVLYVIDDLSRRVRALVLR